MSPERVRLLREACARVGIELTPASSHPLYRHRDEMSDEAEQVRSPRMKPVKTRAPGWERKHDPAKILELCAKGFGKRAISNQLGIPCSTVQSIMKKHGVKRAAPACEAPARRGRWTANNGARACKHDPEQIAQLRAEGLSLREIGAKLGVHHSSVRYVLKRKDQLCQKN